MITENPSITTEQPYQPAPPVPGSLVIDTVEIARQSMESNPDKRREKLGRLALMATGLDDEGNHNWAAFMETGIKSLAKQTPPEEYAQITTLEQPVGTADTPEVHHEHAA